MRKIKDRMILQDGDVHGLRWWPSMLHSLGGLSHARCCAQAGVDRVLSAPAPGASKEALQLHLRLLSEAHKKVRGLVDQLQARCCPCLDLPASPVKFGFFFRWTHFSNLLPGPQVEIHIQKTVRVYCAVNRSPHACPFPCKLEG